MSRNVCSSVSCSIMELIKTDLTGHNIAKR
jgi:hypothetical protein